jgi:hypothetical protein
MVLYLTQTYATQVAQDDNPSPEARERGHGPPLPYPHAY